MELGFVTKAELVGTIFAVLLCYHVLGSMLVKLLGYIKDNTKTRADNIAWGVLRKGAEKVQEALDYIIGNPKH